MFRSSYFGECATGVNGAHEPIIDAAVEIAEVAMAETSRTHGILHGAKDLPRVVVDSYNLEMRDREGGFVGDRASRRAFTEIIEDWRERLRQVADDPLGDKPASEISKRKLDDLLLKGDPETAGLLHGAIEEFAQEMAGVIRRFLRTKGWLETERIAVGGGFRASRIGELAIGRASVLLKGAGIPIDLVPINHDPDEGGLIGAVHLVPRWTLSGHEAMLAVDIGGSNIRAGIVSLNKKRASDFSKAEVWKSELWRHAEDRGIDRDDAFKRLVGMLDGLIGRARKQDLGLAPIIGIGCPGIITAAGDIERGGQNLPGGDWEKNFNLPARLREEIPQINEHETVIVLHNDAVVQGLSQLSDMQDVEHWGIVTVGTGLGNARFTNLETETA